MTGAGTTLLADDAGEQTITDVWSRTSPKYRKRAIVLLIVNVFLFAGLGAFAFWLRTGINFAPVQENYWQILGETFMPRGDVNLGNFVLFPIRLDLVPMHGVVVGLLLAALVSVPILIAILYRFPCSIPFILIIALIAVMPWLAINVAGACVLASVRPFRFRFRYASALLGLMLVLLYFYGASRQTTPPVEHYNPADRLKFMSPWILATFASCLIMGVVLFLAKVVNYRPGVVAPLVVISFAAPVLLFEWHVGRDELYYRLLEQRFRDDFGDRDARMWFDRITKESWAIRPEPKPSLEEYRAQVDLRLALELASASDMRSSFAQQQEDFILDCRDFVRAFPDSRYAPNVLYLQGQAMDARIDVDAFSDKKLLRVYFDFPVSSPRAELVWQKVIYNAPASTTSAVARYKLALLEARAGRVGRAVELLDELIARFGTKSTNDGTAQGKAGPVSRALASAPPDASLKILVDNVVFEGQRLLNLLLNNADDPLYGVRPLCGAQPPEPRQAGLLQLDPHARQYPGNLAVLLRHYATPAALAVDNIALRLALTRESPEDRAHDLAECVAQYPGGDALPETLYQLGVAYQETRADDLSRQTLSRVSNEFPNSLWAEQAVRRLRTLPAVESAP